MKLTVSGDFNCPYSYLASQRASQLIRGGMAQADWRAVEHDRRLALTGTSSAAGRGTWERELALPGEHAPAAPPPVVSNTRAAVAAYAEAISDGIAAELRRRLFRAIWGEGRHLSSAHEVRRLVSRLMWPQEDIGDRLASRTSPACWIGIRISSGSRASRIIGTCPLVAAEVSVHRPVPVPLWLTSHLLMPILRMR